MEERQQPHHDELSDLKVLRSPSGYYLGRQQYDAHIEEWMPYNRITDYMNSHRQAKELLDKSKEFRITIEGIGTENLKTLTKSLASADMIQEDPHNLFKSNLIKDHLQHERQPTKQIEKQEPQLSR